MYLRRTNQQPELGEQRLLRKATTRCLRDPEVDHLRDWVALDNGDQYVRGFQIAVDDALLVRMLDGTAHLKKERQPLACSEVMPIAVVRDRHTRNVLHDKVRPAGVGLACVEDCRNARMVHQGQSFALRLEPCDDVTRVHTRLDDLQGDTSLGRLLLGKIDRPHSSLRNQAQNAIRPDHFLRGIPCVDGQGDRRILSARRRDVSRSVLVGCRRGRLVLKRLSATTADIAGRVLLEEATAPSARPRMGFQDGGFYSRAVLDRQANSARLWYPDRVTLP